jgi:hypothetical protein
VEFCFRLESSFSGICEIVEVADADVSPIDHDARMPLATGFVSVRALDAARIVVVHAPVLMIQCVGCFAQIVWAIGVFSAVLVINLIGGPTTMREGENNAVCFDDSLSTTNVQNYLHVAFVVQRSS